MGALDFQLRNGGLHFPSLGIWMDPREPVGPGQLVVVTHAHADHIGDHAEVVLTEPTRRLMRARMSGNRTEHVLPFHAVANLQQPPFLPPRDASLELVPAGHVLGSAMARLSDGQQSLLYTGDFKLRHGLSAEPCAPCPSDILVMETTYGRPHYVFPPVAEVLRGILNFCHEAIDNDEVPVLLGYSLGKAQEMLAALHQAALPVMLAEPVARLTRIYEDLGHSFPPHARLDPSRARGHVVVAPPGGNVPALRRRLAPCRVAILSGWALDPGCRFRHQADAAFPLSDHADFAELLELVRIVSPRRVFTLHGFAADFAAHLRRMGIEAWALQSAEQLELAISPTPTASPAPPKRPASHPPPPDAVGAMPSLTEDLPLAALAEACQAIRKEHAKGAKVILLARFLDSVPDSLLPQVVAWFCGLAMAPGSKPAPAVGWALLRDAACIAAGCPPQAFQEAYLLHGDTAETTADLWRDHPGDALRRPTLHDVLGCLDAMAQAPSNQARRELLAGLLRRCTAPEARQLVKLLTGNLRIGLKEGLVEEAIAMSFHADVAEIRHASMVTGDLGGVAAMARSRSLHQAVIRPLRPVRVMLASPEPTPSAVHQRIIAWTATSPQGAWAEDKHDGIRCQVHLVNGEARLFSRDLKDITATFPEVAAELSASGLEGILDGELLAMDGDRPRPFAELQRRLGRVEPDLFLASQFPVAFVAFDLLWADGTTLLAQPHRARHERLTTLATHARIRVARGRWVRDEDEVRMAFGDARQRGHEGLVIKDPASPYLPGRRGMGWLKLKQALGTLDCVVVGAEYGHGRRSGVLSDYTFALRDADSGQLRIVGKAYSGLTNTEIDALTQRLLARVIRMRGRVHEVEPEVVLEIAFDSIQRSPRHDSGLALRFPRIVRIRDDKGPGECDTVQWAVRMLPGSPG